MAIASGAFGQTFVDSFDGGHAVDLSSETNIKAGLIEDIASPPAFDTTSLHGWGDITGTDKVTGTGTFTGTLTTTTVDVTTTANYWTFDAADEVYSTLTTDAPHIEGCAIYDDAPTTPKADPMLCIVDFGANFPITAGDFSIAWAATGILRISLT